MKVSILGGARDGEEIDTPRGQYSITFPVQPLLSILPDDNPEGMTIKTITLPILKNSNGKFYVQWPKGK